MPRCEACGVELAEEGRRTCPGIGPCWRMVHARDQRERHAAALMTLKRKANNAVCGNAIDELIEEAFEAGRRF